MAAVSCTVVCNYHVCELNLQQKTCQLVRVSQSLCIFQQFLFELNNCYTRIHDLILIQLVDQYYRLCKLNGIETSCTENFIQKLLIVAVFSLSFLQFNAF